MCEFCGDAYVVNPGVAKLWEEQRKQLEKDDPALAAYIDRAAGMLKEEIERANAIKSNNLSRSDG